MKNIFTLLTAKSKQNIIKGLSYVAVVVTFVFVLSKTTRRKKCNLYDEEEEKKLYNKNNNYDDDNDSIEDNWDYYTDHYDNDD